MIFRFDDERSQRQIAKALVHSRSTKRQNGDGMTAYYTQKGNLAESRNEWEQELTVEDNENEELS